MLSSKGNSGRFSIAQTVLGRACRKRGAHYLRERTAAQVDLESATSALKDTKEQLAASRKAEAEAAQELAALQKQMAERDAQLKEQEGTHAELMSMFSAVQAKLTKKG